MEAEAALQQLLPDGRCTTAPVDLWAYARDCSTRGHIRARAGEALARPRAVVWPESVQEVEALVSLARQHGFKLVPFGAGSGVVSGIEGDARAVVVDLKRFDQLTLDPERRLCVAGAGVIGEQLERWLNERGFSLGHFPSSIYCSSVGGWVATRSAGQLSSRYGKIEDMVRWLEAVDGTGTRRTLRRGCPDLDGLGLAIGSEGALMVITRAALTVHPLPMFRALRGAEFASVEQAVEAMRALLRSGLTPTILRLYDPLDTLLSGHAGGEPDLSGPAVEPGAIGRAGLEQIKGSEEPHDWFVQAARASGGVARLADRLGLERALQETSRQALRRLTTLGGGTWPRLGSLLARNVRQCRLVYGFEGEHREVAALVDGACSLIAEMGGRDLGPDPGRHWLARRYGVSYKMSRVLDAGLWVDTFEVAVRWSKLIDLYRAVRRAVRTHALCLAHFSHAYPDGCSIYFTFVGGGETADEAIANHAATWEAGLRAARSVEAVLSHHHGIGRLKARALAGVEGQGSSELRRALKQALDPDQLLNPGVLGLGEEQDVAAQPPAATGLTSVKALRRLRRFTLDLQSGLVRVAPQQRLSVLSARLAEIALEIGARPGGWGNATVADALRMGEPRLLARLSALEAAVDGKPLFTPLAPRAATGPDTRAFALGRGVEGLALRHVWLCARELPEPVARAFTARDLATLLAAGRDFGDQGASAVEIELGDEPRLYLLHRGDPRAARVWMARVEAAQGLVPCADEHARRWCRVDLAAARREVVLAAYPDDPLPLLERLAAWSGASRGRHPRAALAPGGGVAVVARTTQRAEVAALVEAAPDSGIAERLAAVRSQRRGQP